MPYTVTEFVTGVDGIVRSQGEGVEAIWAMGSLSAKVSCRRGSPDRAEAAQLGPRRQGAPRRRSGEVQISRRQVRIGPAHPGA